MLAIPLDAGGGKFRGSKSWTPKKPMEVGGNQKMIQLFPGNLTASETPKKVTEVWGLDGSDGWQILFPFGSDV